MIKTVHYYGQWPAWKPVHLWLQTEVAGGLDLPHERNRRPDILQQPPSLSREENQQSYSTVIWLHNNWLVYESEVYNLFLVWFGINTATLT